MSAFVKGLFYLGILTSVAYLVRLTKRGSGWLWDYMRSLFNAKKYLTSKVEASQIANAEELRNPSFNRYYAVIYGSNRAAHAYAEYLSLEKGFNLILIDSDLAPVQKLEDELFNRSLSIKT